jgi:hypothetical protein
MEGPAAHDLFRVVRGFRGNTGDEELDVTIAGVRDPACSGSAPEAADLFYNDAAELTTRANAITGAYGAVRVLPLAARVGALFVHTLLQRA